MKKILYSILLLGFAQSMFYGQQLPEYQKKQKETALASPYIFEGIALYDETYLNPADGHMWMSEYVLVTNIFRGQDKIVPGMIEVTVRMGGDKVIYHKDRQYVKFPHTQPQVYFCNDVSVATPISDTIKTDNKIKVASYSGFTMPDRNIDQAGFYDELFKTKKDVYNFLGNLENIDKKALVRLPDTMKAYHIYYVKENRAWSDYDQSLRDARKAKADTLKKKEY